MNSMEKERKKLAKDKVIKKAQQKQSLQEYRGVVTMGSNDADGAVGNKAKQAQERVCQISKALKTCTMCSLPILS
jgi:hypothetical protein